MHKSLVFDFGSTQRLEGMLNMYYDIGMDDITKTENANSYIQ